MIQVNRERYEIVEEKREGFHEEAFIGRFSDVLEKYDYIVGDWGHGQLRLRGFYEDNHEKATFDTKNLPRGGLFVRILQFRLCVFYRQTDGIRRRRRSTTSLRRIFGEYVKTETEVLGGKRRSKRSQKRTVIKMTFERMFPIGCFRLIV